MNHNALVTNEIGMPPVNRKIENGERASLAAYSGDRYRSAINGPDSFVNCQILGLFPLFSNVERVSFGRLNPAAILQLDADQLVLVLPLDEVRNRLVAGLARRLVVAPDLVPDPNLLDRTQFLLGVHQRALDEAVPAASAQELLGELQQAPGRGKPYPLHHEPGCIFKDQLLVSHENLCHVLHRERHIGHPQPPQRQLQPNAEHWPGQSPHAKPPARIHEVHRVGIGVVLVGGGATQRVGLGDQVALGVVGLGLGAAVGVAGEDLVAIGVVLILGTTAERVDLRGLVTLAVVLGAGAVAQGIDLLDDLACAVVDSALGLLDGGACLIGAGEGLAELPAVGVVAVGGDRAQRIGLADEAVVEVVGVAGGLA